MPGLRCSPWVCGSGSWMGAPCTMTRASTYTMPWRLAIGDGYAHSPWMHGPFQVELTSLVFKLFSDTDFTGRLAYAFFGSALVMLPYFLRTYLGRAGAVVTSILLALSPSLLYFSRFGRNDILMAVWAVALLILMWRYLNEGKNRYLYMPRRYWPWPLPQRRPLT